MRALPLVLLALSAAPAAADPLSITDKDGSPAIEAAGSSSTTLSVLGGSARVTVQGGGKLNVYTNSGTVSGEGGLGVPELGVSLGGALDPNTGDATASGNEGAVEPDASLVVTGEASMDSAQQCATSLPATSMDVAAIGRIVDSEGIAIVAACDDQGRSAMDAIRIAAIESNSAVMAALAARGYGADDVLAVERNPAGGALLFVSSGA